jgi:hypothetical protein
MSAAAADRPWLCTEISQEAAMSVARRIRRTAVAISVAAVATAAGMSAAPADAAIGSPTGQLTVGPFSPGYHNVAVFGTVPMTRAEAQSLVNSNHRIVLRLWGDDVFSDDLLIGPYNATLVPTDKGLEFHKVLLQIDDDRLNEDWGQDELYVGMRLVNPNGATIRSGETNRVNGRY